eukprot:1905823-Prymnesium_polylepis.1
MVDVTWTTCSVENGEVTAASAAAGVASMFVNSSGRVIEMSSVCASDGTRLHMRRPVNRKEETDPSAACVALQRGAGVGDGMWRGVCERAACSASALSVRAAVLDGGSAVAALTAASAVRGGGGAQCDMGSMGVAWR